VHADLLPWCRRCRSHHAPPLLWRYATVEAGARLDSRRRYRLDEPGRPPPASEVARRFLRVYEPAKPDDLAEWAGLARRHARRLWRKVGHELAEVAIGRSSAWVPTEDLGVLTSAPTADGVRLLPPGDPYLQRPNQPLLAPDPALRKRLFQPVASPGAVLHDGRLAGLWRARAKRRRLEVAVEPLGRLARAPLEEEAQRVAAVLGAAGAALAVA
jgi:hypothetical protein